MRALKSRSYRPETDAPAAEAFHLALMREHYRLWSQLTGEPHDAAHWDRVLEEEGVGARWREELARRTGDGDAFLRVYTVEGSDEAVGILFLEIRRDPLTFRREGFINEIFLRPEYRGKGLSRRMLEEGETWFDERGVPSRHVFVTVNNLAAVRLYQRIGYQVTDYRMTKREQPPANEIPGKP